MDSRKVVISNKNLLPFVLVTSMFFMWGLANNMTDTLLAAFKKIMSMSDFQTSWIQSAFYGAYFCLALPAAILISRFSYKTGLLVGLGMFITGALFFYPASQTMVYGHFLAALFILAGGLSILETTANPYILYMGDEETSIRRLNLAQSFNPIGSITGVLLSKFFILDSLNAADSATRAGLTAAELEKIQRGELSAVMGPYVGVAILLGILWLMIAIIRMPAVSEKEKLDITGSMRRLFRNSNYRNGVIAQFFYVGAQIGVWSFTIRYVMLELKVGESEAANYYLAALVLFTISRFGFTVLLKRFSARSLLTGSALVAVGLLFVVIFGSGIIGTVALVGISGCMSLMFPTIFGMALKGTGGTDQKLAGSGLIMAIVGGAVLTAVQGLVSDSLDSIKLAFSVPLICFAIIAAYGWSSKVSGS